MMAHSCRGKLRWFDMLWHLSECEDPTIYIAVVTAYGVSHSFLLQLAYMIITFIDTAMDIDQ